MARKPNRPRTARVWNTKRKLMGNLIPALIGVPPIAYGLCLVQSSLLPLGVGIRWIVGGVVAMWVAVDVLGLWGNAWMRRELGRRIGDGKAAEDRQRVFVGCSTPAYAGLLDPHEDVGFLTLGPDRLVFQGDSLELVMMKADVRRIRYRPNVHTAVGLGRWISIEGEAEGARVRMLVEPREQATLTGNLLVSRKLRKRLEDWLKEAGPG